ncbi:PPE domain-containing protein [Rhodococcus sp. MEB064]|uniref:PPE domain-containing protein n=1 Tax=Rhodococcus sp. MEB064 TaxID=1587522 RepID=UPI0006978A4A|nr:PPE domain-containing protein [Rhodococcus sp. MEB064]
MTAGPTGVFWLPRTATVNSAALSLGAGPVPLLAAGTAWGGVAAAVADAAATVARVTAELAVTWSGDAAGAASAGLTSYTAWITAAAEHAASVSARATAQAAAVTTALAVMPSIPEIAAVKAGRTTAYAVGGALTGAAQAADAADAALDVRAALVMEAYEAASAHLALPAAFDAPPQVVTAVTAPAGPTVTPVLAHADKDVSARPEEGERDDSLAPRGSDPVTSKRTPDVFTKTVEGLREPATTHAVSIAQQVPSHVVSAVTSGSSPGPSMTTGSWMSPIPAPNAAPTGPAGWSSAGAMSGVSSGAVSPGRTAFATSSVIGNETIGDAGSSAVLGESSSRAGLGAGLPTGGVRHDEDTVTSRRTTTTVVEIDDGVPVVPAVIGARS